MIYVQNKQILKIALIVSSNKKVREHISDLLQKVNISFVFESVKTSAIFRILDLNFKLVIYDAERNGEDDLDFIRLVRRLRPRLPVMVVTEDTESENQQSLFDAGASYVLMKPVEEKKIQEMVGELVV